MMQWFREKPGRVRVVVLIALTALLLGAVLAPFLMRGDAQLSAYASGSKDLNAFREAVAGVQDVEVRAVVASPLVLEEIERPEDALLFVIGVEKPLTRTEADAILAFVARGGKLVLADDTGNANALLKDLGAAVIGRQLVDTENNYKPVPGGEGDPEFPVAEARFAGRTYPLLFNQPSFITFFGNPRGSVLAESSSASFDAPDGSEVDIRSEPGPYPLIVEFPYEAGRILLVSDSGPFVNGVVAASGGAGDVNARYRNFEFIQALTQDYLPRGGVAIVDESRHVQPPAVRAMNGALRAYALATLTPLAREVATGLVIAAAAVAVWRTRHAEDWSTHVFSVGEKRPLPEEIAPTPERLRGMAVRAAAEKLNVSTEYLQAMSREEVARLTGDADLAAVIAGDSRGVDTRVILQKLSGATEERAR